VSRFVLGVLAALAMTAATGAATVAVARESGWTLSQLSWLDRPVGPLTIVLHRHGGEVWAGADDSPRLHLSGTVSRQGLTSVRIPAFRGSDDDWDELVECVQDRFDGLAVDVVDEPPTFGSYTLAYVGGTPDLLGYADTVGGIAPHSGRVLDNAVLFVFQAEDTTLRSLCETASHEIGHTLGLGHTTAADSVMAFGYDTTNPGDLGFHDGCVPIIQVSGQSAACVGVNKCHCGVNEQQDDKATLSATFAPAGVDIVEPTISILQPADGAVYQEGETVRVEFEPWDDVGGYGWALQIEDSAGELLLDQVDYDRAMIFDLTGLPPDTYVLTAYIRDHADHVVTDAVTITVEGEEAMDESGGSEGSGTGADAGTSTGEGSGSGDATDSEDGGPAADEGEIDDGCGCTTLPARSGGAWLLGLVALLGLSRRRR